MTHFAVIVLVPPGTVITNEAQLATIMAPYDENKRVDPYQDDCSCGRIDLKTKADNYAVKKLGKSWDDFRKEYRAKSDSEKESLTWEQFTKPLRDLEDDYEKSHHTKPRPDCSDCHGTGKYTTTYNPHSKWDWYAIGGRWTGTLPDNQCKASEFMIIWKACLRASYNEMVKKYEEELKESKLFGKPAPHEPYKYQFYIPSHIVTPEEGWIAKHRNGWWGTVTETYISDEEWQKKFQEMLAKYPEHTAVVVDCHI